MQMAKSTADFLKNNLRYSNGAEIECVIADTCIGGVAEAAECAEKFQNEKVGVSLTVTPCWCYGTEVMDSDPLIPKAVWGFNGTERPGAVYLAAALAGYNQKGLPAFSIYGYDVQDSDDTSIPDDVKEKLLLFAKAGLTAAEMNGKSYLFLTKGEMPVTMSRINLIKGLGPVLQIAEGYTIELPPDVHETLNRRTSPTWPTTWFAPILTGKGAFTDVYSVMANWGANHGAISYGHIGHRLMTLASMLRIPVNMHNVSADRIFRPSAWNAFGTMDLESADYRACENFGPLYGKR